MSSGYMVLALITCLCRGAIHDDIRLALSGIIGGILHLKIVSIDSKKIGVSGFVSIDSTSRTSPLLPFLCLLYSQLHFTPHLI